MDQILLASATLLFAVNFALVFTGMLRGQARRLVLELSLACAGFALQSAWLWDRGQLHGRCPITSACEVLVFLSWAVMLWYFLLGSTYRLSLLGVFSSGLVAGLQSLALLPAIHSRIPAPALGKVDPWLELHASLSLLAYGAFGIASLAAIMFIFHDRQLKKRPPPRVFLHLPPITQLFRAMMLVLLLGCVLLAAGMGAGYFTRGNPSGAKYMVSYAVLAIYGVVVALRWTGSSHRRVAMGAVAGFVIAVLSLWVVS